MAAPSFRAMLLLALAICLRPSHAEPGSVSLSVCNAGKVDIDALIVKDGPVVRSHVVPGGCATIYAVGNGPPASAYVGFAFVDSAGQWGTARRLDLLPDLGLVAGRGIEVLSAADKKVSVRQANKDLPGQLQLLFQPRAPSCHQRNPHSAVQSLPWNATAAQKSWAYSQDSLHPPDYTVDCEQLDYILAVVAFPDTREITFKYDCAQRAVNQCSEVRFQTVSWSDMPDYLLYKYRQGSWQKDLNENIAVRGTVSRVELNTPPTERSPWVDIYFRESADGKFDVCSSKPAIFEDMFGPDFRTSMIGKTLEVHGQIQRAWCDGKNGSIRVSLAHQLKADAERVPEEALRPVLEQARQRDQKRNAEIATTQDAAHRSIANFGPGWSGLSLAVKGTVSRVELKPGGTLIGNSKPFQWVTLYFQESPGGAFIVCFPDNEKGLGGFDPGGDFKGLIGKTIEASGTVQRAFVPGARGIDAYQKNLPPCSPTPDSAGMRPYKIQVL